MDHQSISKALNIPVQYLEASESTQTDAKTGAKAYFAGPKLYIASQQGHAVGRFGRPFYTKKGQGIYMTLHLPLNIMAQAMPPYTLLVAASIVNAIKDLTQIETRIKWVNDIYKGDKKIAGILTELRTNPFTGVVQDVFIGVGLNFYIQEFPKELENKAGSLFDEPTQIKMEDLIIKIWENFFNTDYSNLLEDYRAASLVLNRLVTFKEKEKQLQGTATAVLDNGDLVVQLENGQEKILSSGEISLLYW